MKRQIRTGVFETNSSSVHSIAIPKEADAPKYVSFGVGEFGWEFGVADPADYFYTAMYEVSNTKQEFDKRFERLKSILEGANVEFSFKKPRIEQSYFALVDGYIDHGRELTEFVDELLADGDKLLRFLGNGLVFTGNDNAGEDRLGYIAPKAMVLKRYNWGTEKYEAYDNPYYRSDADDYVWYEKD